jgi:serine/threonine protein kinase
VCPLFAKLMRATHARGGDKYWRRELTLLRRLNHPNVIRMLDVFVNDDKKKLYVFMEFCVCGLQDMLDAIKPRPFPVAQVHWCAWAFMQSRPFFDGKNRS